MRWKLSFCALYLASAPAMAAVEQTDGTVIPLLPSMAERSLVTDTYGWSAQTSSWIGLDGESLVTPIVYGAYYSPPDFPQFVDGDAITLAGLFKWRGEAIDWKLDATAPSGAFTPHCPITVEPVLRGGNCDATLAWYNVPDATSQAPPAKAELYELLPAKLGQFLDCRDTSGIKTDGFCPLAWDTRLPRNLSLHGWVPRSVTLDLSTDPHYLGGAIGFALVPAVATSYCKDPHYSVLAHNARDAANQPYVTSIVYTSRRDPGAFYLAFDDGVMLPDDWTNLGRTDGDYNDYVAYVSGCFDGQGGGSGAGGAASGDGAGAPSDAGSPASGAKSGSNGGGSANSGGGSASGGGGSANSGGSREPVAEGGDAAPDHGRAGDGTGASSDDGGRGSGTGSSSSDGSCGCRLASPSGSSSVLFACALSVGWWRRRLRHQRPASFRRTHSPGAGTPRAT